MSGFADASLGDDPGSRAARVGTIVLVNGGFVCGKSSKLKRVQISSAGAELHGLSACAHELTAMRNQLKESLSRDQVSQPQPPIGGPATGELSFGS